MEHLWGLLERAALFDSTSDVEDPQQKRIQKERKKEANNAKEKKRLKNVCMSEHGSR